MFSFLTNIVNGPNTLASQHAALIFLIAFMLLLSWVASLNDHLELFNSLAMVLGIGAIIALINTGDRKAAATQ